MQLRLAYNRGLAFGLGAALPGAVVLVLTAVLTVGLAVYLWRETATSPRLISAALAVVLTGAAPTSSTGPEAVW